MLRFFQGFCFVGFVIGCTVLVDARPVSEDLSAIEKTRQLVDDISRKSFPEINLTKIKIKTFQSDKNFFKARFSYTRFLTFQKMRYIVYVNPKVFKLFAPENGIRAILAHELAHIFYYTEKNRFELLGLISLVSGKFTTKFERKADLEAIKRGYGKGLIEYREWLYKNIPPKTVRPKKRDYFSPAEIELILDVLADTPEMIGIWRKEIPKNIYEIKKSIE
jgi:hypothetical protein